ncbi:MAG: cyclopropane-fatty-acyl-phospholipid synthase family protein [Bryobacteraceae bacterium]
MSDRAQIIAGLFHIASQGQELLQRSGAASKSASVEGHPAKSPHARVVTISVRKCREAGRKNVCARGFDMILRHAGGPDHENADLPINLLDFLDGIVQGTKPQDALGCLRVLKFEPGVGTIACHLMADLHDWVIRKFGPDPLRIRQAAHLRSLAADPDFRGEWTFRQRWVAEQLEGFALRTAWEAARLTGRLALERGATVEQAVKTTERAWDSAWRDFAAIMRRYLLRLEPAPKAPAEPVACQPYFAPKRQPDVSWEPASERAVTAMLKLAGVRKGDVVYDLGCGDGRVVIAAAKQFGARGVGIDIDPQRIAESHENARRAGVTALVAFREEDLFEADIREATVVALFLLPPVNRKLCPKLLRELKPGARIVSCWHDMGDWPPHRQKSVDGARIFLWTIPQTRPEPAPEASGEPVRCPERSGHPLVAELPAII